MQDIKALSLQELIDVFKEWGESAFHARQVYAWIYKKREFDFGRMSDLSQPLREKLAGAFVSGTLEVKEHLVSVDGTEKFLFGLRDRHLIEGVVIPAEGRITGCISTQAGCRFSCRFCASGLLGFQRNLGVAEMLDEIILMSSRCRQKRLTHLVFMGSGEPLDNYDNLMKTIRMANSASALGIGARRITISTCGIIPGIAKLAHEGLQVELSVSLHAPDDKTRSALMPVNRIFPVRELIACCRRYVQATKRQVTFEYVLIKGVNSDLQKAGQLSTILRGFDCKVNLIPVNPVPELGVQPPGKLEILLFKDALVKAGIQVTLRKPRGQDVMAACGQLRLRHAQKTRKAS